MKAIIKIKEYCKKFKDKWLINKVYSYFQEKRRKKQFKKIYKENFWQGKISKSGPGSDPEQTRLIKKLIPKIFEQFKIKKILDAGCGDFIWFKEILNLNDTPWADVRGFFSSFGGVKSSEAEEERHSSTVLQPWSSSRRQRLWPTASAKEDKDYPQEYIGIDIVREIIQENQQKYGNKKIKFILGDILLSNLPKCDLIICRDCLVHLSFKEIKKAIINFKKSKSKYLMMMTFVNCEKNLDISTGEWRALNFSKNPFSFPEPLMIVNERCTEGKGAYKDKSLAVWQLSKIRL